LLQKVEILVSKIDIILCGAVFEAEGEYNGNAVLGRKFLGRKLNGPKG
jgi:hypothetical protein